MKSSRCCGKKKLILVAGWVIYLLINLAYFSCGQFNFECEKSDELRLSKNLNSSFASYHTGI